MTTVSVKRERRSIKEVLRVEGVVVEHPSHFERLHVNGRTECGSYHEALRIKAELDSPMNHQRGIITPLMSGWEVKVVHDDPKDRLGRSSEVLDLVIEAEEKGLSVLELMGYNPGKCSRSSGNSRQRTNHPNAVAESSYRRSQAAAWGSLD